MKILIITPHYYPEQFNITQIAEHLVISNNVTVWTNIPNYPQGDFYKKYGYLKNRKEIINKVTVHRLFIIPRKKNLIFLGLNYLTFLISGIFKSLFNQNKFDLIINFQISPITSALPSFFIRKRKKGKIITYVQDVWPESIQIALNISSKNILYKILNKISRYVYTNSDALFLSSNEQLKHLAKKYKIDKKNMFYVPNFAPKIFDLKEIKHTEYKFDKSKVNVLFAGNIGKAQNLDLLIEVALKMKSNNVDYIKFIIVGDGSEKSKLISIVLENNLGTYFDFVEKQPVQNIPYFYLNTDILYASLLNNQYINLTLPSKIQSYMAFEKPIFAIACGETLSVLNNYKYSKVICDYDINIIYDNLIEFCNNYTNYDINKNYYKDNFTYDIVMNKIELLINKLCKD